MNESMLIMYAVLGGELLLLLFVLLIVSWFRSRGARRRDSKAIQILVKRIKKGKPEREAAVERCLSEGMGMTGEALQRTKVGMLRAQLVLLQRFAAIYQMRDAAAAAQFDADLAAALVAYHQLQGGVTAEPGKDAAVVDTAELEALRAENKRLADELSASMETMSRMLDEYTSVFGSAAPGAVAPTVALAGTAVAAGEDDNEGMADAMQAQDEVIVEEESDELLASAGSVTQQAEHTETEPTGATDGAELPSAQAQPVEHSMFADPPEPEPAADAVATDADQVAAIEVEAGDDLDDTIGVWEEGPVEVVTFDQPEQVDIEVGAADGTLSDSTQAEAIARVQATLDGAVGAAERKMPAEGLVDAGEQPLQRQSGT